MKKLMMMTIGSAALALSAQAVTINGYKVESLFSNTTGTFSSTTAFPGVQMNIANQAPVNGGEQFGERYAAWLSADGGATKAQINGRKSFTLEWDMTLRSSYRVEGGLLMRYDNSRGFRPESQYYVSKTPTSTNIQTSADWVLPPMDFSAAGATYNLGDTVRMKLEYFFNGASSVQRISYGSFSSPWINGHWGGPMYDAQMEFGFYFQPTIPNATSPQNSSADFNLVSFTESAVPEPASVTALALGALMILRRKRNS
jgi:hypothetical protein